MRTDGIGVEQIPRPDSFDTGRKQRAVVDVSVVPRLIQGISKELFVDFSKQTDDRHLGRGYARDVSFFRIDEGIRYPKAKIRPLRIIFSRD